jgi:hypothetical protein
MKRHLQLDWQRFRHAEFLIQHVRQRGRSTWRLVFATVNAMTLFNKSSAQVTIVTGTATAGECTVRLSVRCIEASNHPAAAPTPSTGKAGSVQGAKGELKAYGYSTLTIDDSADGGAPALRSRRTASPPPAEHDELVQQSGVINVPVAVIIGSNADTLNAVDRQASDDRATAAAIRSIGNGGSGHPGAVDVSNYSSRTAVRSTIQPIPQAHRRLYDDGRPGSLYRDHLARERRQQIPGHGRRPGHRQRASVHMKRRS